MVADYAAVLEAALPLGRKLILSRCELFVISRCFAVATLGFASITGDSSSEVNLLARET